MPYRTKTLTATGDALSLEIKAELDAALTASGKYTRVTTAFVNATRTYDVWQNDGTTDGYGWFLIVCTDTANTGRCVLGGALEYDPATQIAKKALRGANTVGYVDAAGYPLVAAGGAEMTFPLGSFVPGLSNTVGLLAGLNSWPTAAVTGDTVRVLVTGQVAWLYWGNTSTMRAMHAVGTYQNIHSTTHDLKPLGFLMGPSTYGTSVWQHPAATDTGTARTIYAAPYSLSSNVLSALAGTLGTAPELSRGTFVGSRFRVTRGISSAEAPATVDGTSGGSLGLAPADFLIFHRNASVAVGDTITVGGKAYVSVSAPAAGSGLFVNTQPAV